MSQTITLTLPDEAIQSAREIAGQATGVSKIFWLSLCA